MEIIIITILVASILFYLVYSADRKEKKEQNIAKINNLYNSLIGQGFKPSLTVKGYEQSYYFAVDQNKKLIAITTIKGISQIPFNSIISVEVKEDNTTVLTKSSSRSIGGAIIGGAIAGEAGAIVGGLSGDATTNKKVSSVKVKIRVRDLSQPSYEIVCFDSPTMCGVPEINTTDILGDVYKKCLKDANKIADTISVIIDDEDRKFKKQLSTNSAAPLSNSIADELEKLANLKDRGVLTEEEFNEQKKKLLSSNLLN